MKINDILLESFSDTKRLFSQEEDTRISHMVFSKNTKVNQGMIADWVQEHLPTIKEHQDINNLPEDVQLDIVKDTPEIIKK